MKEKRMYNRSK